MKEYHNLILFLAGIVVLIIAAPFVWMILFVVADHFEPSPKNQAQVERFFERNYEHFKVVANYLATIEHDRRVEIRSWDFEHTNSILYKSLRFEGELEKQWERTIIEDNLITEAIGVLQTTWYHHIYKDRNIIRFQRDSRGEWSRRYMHYRTGVKYSVDGTDLSYENLPHEVVIPLSSPNWFFYMRNEAHMGA